MAIFCSCVCVWRLCHRRRHLVCSRDTETTNLSGVHFDQTQKKNEWMNEAPNMCNSFNMPLSAAQFILSPDERHSMEAIDKIGWSTAREWSVCVFSGFGVFCLAFHGLLVIVIHRHVNCLAFAKHARSLPVRYGSQHSQSICSTTHTHTECYPSSSFASFIHCLLWLLLLPLLFFCCCVMNDLFVVLGQAQQERPGFAFNIFIIIWAIEGKMSTWIFSLHGNCGIKFIYLIRGSR